MIHRKLNNDFQIYISALIGNNEIVLTNYENQIEEALNDIRDFAQKIIVYDFQESFEIFWVFIELLVIKFLNVFKIAERISYLIVLGIGPTRPKDSLFFSYRSYFDLSQRS